MALGVSEYPCPSPSLCDRVPALLTLRRWHRAFTWRERIGIALLFGNGFGHLWLVLR